MAAPTVFFHEERQIRCVVHGDDFAFFGFDKDLDFVSELMAKWYEIKVRGRLGGELGGHNEITLLNRVVKWYGSSLNYEADPKHVQVLCDVLELCGKSAGDEGPIVKETKEEVAKEEEDPVGEEEAT